MFSCVRLLTAMLLLVFSVPAPAVDLATIDRAIAKEPAYQSKSAKYCLLVFGPEAKTRVWLVQDGDRLYVDRNANGDLTDPGELIAPKAGDGTDLEAGTFLFEAGDIHDGTLVHKNLLLSIQQCQRESDPRYGKVLSWDLSHLEAP